MSKQQPKDTNAPQSEVMTLEECKKKIAQNKDFPTWTDLYVQYLSSQDYNGLEIAHREASELFASQFQFSIKELEEENFKLAAYQCDEPYGDEYGNKRCEYQDKVLKLEAELSAVKEALTLISQLPEIDYEGFKNIRKAISIAKEALQSTEPNTKE